MTKSLEQHKEEVQAVYDQAGKPWTVKGVVGEYTGARTTKLICECSVHGEWRSTNINGAKRGSGCPSCLGTNIQKTKRSATPDSEHIAQFIKAIGDGVDRKYYRSERKTKQGGSNFWIYECSVCSHDEYVKAGVCNGLFEINIGGLKKGKLACRCSPAYKFTTAQWIFRMTKTCQERGDQFIGFVGKIGAKQVFNYLCNLHGEQSALPYNYLIGKGCPQCAGKNMQEFYINAILDEYGEDTGAYKLGIAKDSDVRLKGQNAKNNYSMQRVALFDLPSYQVCRALESLLKSKEVVPSIGSVERLHMKDGHSETFLREDLAIVLSAINKVGGIMRQEEIC